MPSRAGTVAPPSAGPSRHSSASLKPQADERQVRRGRVTASATVWRYDNGGMES